MLLSWSRDTEWREDTPAVTISKEGWYRLSFGGIQLLQARNIVFVIDMGEMSWRGGHSAQRWISHRTVAYYQCSCVVVLAHSPYLQVSSAESVIASVSSRLFQWCCFVLMANTHYLGHWTSKTWWVRPLGMCPTLLCQDISAESDSFCKHEGIIWWVKLRREYCGRNI